MNTRSVFALAAFVTIPFGVKAQVSQWMGWPNVTRTATIELAYRNYFTAPRAAPPVTVAAGTNVTLVATPNETGSVTVQWIRDGKIMPQTSRTITYSPAAPGDSGLYSARVTAIDASGGKLTYDTEAAALLVTNDTQRLLNTSTRSRVDATQPVIHGFVVEPCPSPMLILVRAVGPGLSQFGVPDPLTNPLLHVFDAAGKEQPTEPPNFRLVGVLPGIDEVTRRVGAFPLAPGSGDIARLYFLPAGAYTAHVTSGDGTSGTALLEIYTVPL